jgi:hypothetical protein
MPKALVMILMANIQASSEYIDGWMAKDESGLPERRRRRSYAKDAKEQPKIKLHAIACMFSRSHQRSLAGNFNKFYGCFG